MFRTKQNKPPIREIPPLKVTDADIDMVRSLAGDIGGTEKRMSDEEIRTRLQAAYDVELTKERDPLLEKM